MSFCGWFQSPSADDPSNDSSASTAKTAAAAAFFSSTVPPHLATIFKSFSGQWLEVAPKINTALIDLYNYKRLKQQGNPHDPNHYANNLSAGDFDSLLSTLDSFAALLQFESVGRGAASAHGMLNNSRVGFSISTTATKSVDKLRGLWRIVMALHAYLASVVSVTNKCALPDPEHKLRLGSDGLELLLSDDPRRGLDVYDRWNKLKMHLTEPQNDIPPSIVSYFLGFSPEPLKERCASLTTSSSTPEVRHVFFAWKILCHKFLRQMQRAGKSKVPATKKGLDTDTKDLNPTAQDLAACPSLKKLFQDNIGLRSIKKYVLELSGSLSIKRQQGITGIPVGHMCFKGNPGTGKTTIARLLGDILFELGLVEAAPEKPDAEKPKQQPPPPPSPGPNATDVELASHNLKVASITPATKVPLNHDPQRDAAKEVQECIRDPLGFAKKNNSNNNSTSSKNNNTSKSKILLDKLEEIQDMYEPSEDRHNLERKLKAAIRKLDPSALPAYKPVVPFWETSGSELARLGYDKVKAKLTKGGEYGKGIIFVDEAYQLNPESDRDGKQICDLLLERMENARLDQIYILAGYKKDMEDLFKSNSGFASRISHYLTFDDFTDDELYNIFLSMVEKYGGKQFTIDNENTAKAAVARVASKRGPGFGNARDIRVAVDRMMLRQRARLDRQNRLPHRNASSGSCLPSFFCSSPSSSSPNSQISTDDLYTVTEEDALGSVDLAPLDKVFARLDATIGCGQVKYQLLQTASMCLDHRLAERNGTVSSRKGNVLHRVFTGNPGTGKTTLARIYAEILYRIGAVSSDAFVETRAMELKGSALGESKKNVIAIFERADGGVLFIDEAYDLAGGGASSSPGGRSSGGGDPYMEEIVSTFIGRIHGEGSDRCLVIMAGYEKEMKNMFDVNPGLQRRMQWNNRFSLADYSDEELLAGIQEQLLQNESLRNMAFSAPSAAAATASNDDESDEKKASAFVSKLVLNAARNNCFEPALKELRSKRLGLHFGNMGEVSAIVNRVVNTYCDRRNDLPQSTPEFLPSDFSAQASDPSDKQHQKNLEMLKGYQPLLAVSKELTNYVKLQQKIGAGTKVSLSLNIIACGPPGSGKTTGIRMLGSLLKDLGILPSSNVIEKSVSQLQTGYTGQAGLTVRRILDESLGSVLFIDEAYRLAFEGGYGLEIINELVQACTEDRYKGKLAIVLAGYKTHMKRMLKMNPGLESRFQRIINFPKWTAVQCLEHFTKSMTDAGFKWSSSSSSNNSDNNTNNASLSDKLLSVMKDLRRRFGDTFSSGRTVDNFFERCCGQATDSVWVFDEIVPPAIENTFALRDDDDNDDDDDDDDEDDSGVGSRTGNSGAQNNKNNNNNDHADADLEFLDSLKPKQHHQNATQSAIPQQQTKTTTSHQTKKTNKQHPDVQHKKAKKEEDDDVDHEETVMMESEEDTSRLHLPMEDDDDKQTQALLDSLARDREDLERQQHALENPDATLLADDIAAAAAAAASKGNKMTADAQERAKQCRDDAITQLAKQIKLLLEQEAAIKKEQAHLEELRRQKAAAEALQKAQAEVRRQEALARAERERLRVQQQQEAIRKEQERVEQLRRQKAAAEAVLKAQAEVRRQEALAHAERERLRVQQQQEAIRKEQERLEELRRQKAAAEALQKAHAELRRREALARSKQEELRMKKQQEARMALELASLGNCPAGFAWHRTGSGWACGGGTHFMTDAEANSRCGVK